MPGTSYLSGTEPIGSARRIATMNGHLQATATAKILAFPKGGRASFQRAKRFEAIENDNRAAPDVVITDAWYHQAAVEDDGKGH